VTPRDDWFGQAVAMELTEAIEAGHRGLDAFVNGNPAPIQALFAEVGSVSLANPFGPPVTGREAVIATTDRAAANYRNGRVTGIEHVAQRVTSDMAYVVEVERYEAELGGSGHPAAFALRVTTVFVRDGDDWRIAHRHADPITTPRPAEAVLGDSS
jgi:ketosteroid isomerase-like protein